MKIEQLYTKCLAEAAYYVESNGEAAIVDPMRETTPYLEILEKNQTKLKYIFLTHFHADFVSGHVDLAKRTGATIVFGPNAKANFDFHSGTDNEVFKIGDISLTLIHTPGHTMESSSYLVTDKKGKQKYIMTGDCLFIGDVGRPDLAVKSDLTQEDLASHLFDSLRNRIMTLPDDIIIYPNHGAGSACGKNMSKETWDTLGHQKEVNYALRADMTKKKFIKEVLTGLATPPQYFPKNVGLNKGINDEFDQILERGTIALDVDTFKSMAEHPETYLIDTRSRDKFITGTVPGAIFIGLDGSFAPWVGAMLSDLTKPIVFIAEEGTEDEVVTRLSRVGYDNSRGFLKGGIEAWKKEGHKVQSVQSISSIETSKIEGIQLLDVRKESEHFSEHVIGSINFPLDTLEDDYKELDKNKEYHVICGSGYRSLIAMSLLYKVGFTKLVNVQGGFTGVKNDKIMELSAFVCPTTLL